MTGDLRELGGWRVMADLVTLARNPVPNGAVTGMMKSFDGAPLRFARWEATRSPKRGTVCLFGGRTEFIEKYFEAIADLRRRGFAVATLDWRGQGGSLRELRDPRKGHILDFKTYDEDLKRFMRDIVLPDCPPPYIGMAHSMGGNILLRAAAMPGAWFEKIALSAPMIQLNPNSLPPGPKSAVVGFVTVMSALGGAQLYVRGGSDDAGETWPFEANGNLNKVTTDPERFARNNAIVASAPKLGLGSPTYGWMRAAFRSMAMIKTPEHRRAISVPILFAVAGDDPIAHSPAIEDYARGLKLATAITIPHARHEIIQERDDLREQFWAAFDAFTGVTAV
jgi:lysophospholipase